MNTDLNENPPGWYSPTRFDKRNGAVRARIDCIDFDPKALKVGNRVIVSRTIEREAKSRTKANEKIEAFKAELRKRFPGGAIAAEGGALTVAQALDDYLAVQVQGVKSARTVSDYEKEAKAIAAKLGANFPLEKLSASYIRANLWVQGRRYSKRQIETLGRAIRQARIEGHVPAHFDPLAAVPKVGPQFKATRAPGVVIPDAEIAALLESVRHDVQWYAFYYLATLAGPRTNEALAMRWDDFDPAEGTLRVVESKTEAGERFIVLDDLARALFIELRAKRRTDVPWIFPAQEGGAYSVTNFQKMAFKPHMLAAGLASIEGPGPAVNNPTRQRVRDTIVPRWGYYDFRHTAFTRDRNLGINPAHSDAQFGHKTSARMMDPNAAALPYHHQDPGYFPHRRESVKKIAATLKTLLPRRLKAV